MPRKQSAQSKVMDWYIGSGQNSSFEEAQAMTTVMLETMSTMVFVMPS